MSRIMVVDDEVIVTTQLEERLSLMGFEVVGRASSGETCVEMARKLRPDLILMDIVMPGEVDGIDASKAIKRELDIPVIFITAYSDDKLISRARETEPYGYILKPFQEKELKAAIEVALYKRSMEQQLREWEERYRLVVNNANEAIISMDTHEKITFWNRAAQSMFGYSSREIMGKPVTLIVPERFHRNLLSIVSRAFSKGESIAGGKPVEFYGIRKDGSEFPLEFSIASWKTQQGPFLTGIIRDITERKKAEEALRKSEERYRTLYESSRDGIAAADLDGRITECNQAYAKMLGYSRNELKGIRFLEITPSKWHTINEAYVRQVMEQGHAGEFEKEYIRKDGTVFPVSMRSSRIADEAGKPMGLWSIVRDITERKRMEEALRESEQTIRRLAKDAASAHEEERQRVSLEVHDRISQTLTGAFHQLQALESIPLENTEAQQILKRASDLLHESIRESRNIMEDLYSPVLSDFGIVAVIDEELRRFQEDTGCRTKFDKRCAVRPTPEVELTAYRIFREALANIRRHAIGATEVRVYLSDKAEMVSLQVRDNGPGFDVEAAMLNMRLGGLKGMQRRAELGGGTFEVVSSRGHGTTVTVRLPCTSASDEGKEEKTT